MKKITLTLVAILSFIPFCFCQTLKLPYVFENNSEYLDSEIYVALVGNMKHGRRMDEYDNKCTCNHECIL